MVSIDTLVLPKRSATNRATQRNPFPQVCASEPSALNILIFTSALELFWTNRTPSAPRMDRLSHRSCANCGLCCSRNSSAFISSMRTKSLPDPWHLMIERSMILMSKTRQVSRVSPAEPRDLICELLPTSSVGLHRMRADHGFHIRIRHAGNFSIAASGTLRVVQAPGKERTTTEDGRSPRLAIGHLEEHRSRHRKA